MKVSEETWASTSPPIVKFSLAFNVTVMFLSTSIAAMICSPDIKWALIAPLTLNSLLIKPNIGCVTSAKVLVSPAFSSSASVNVTSVKELGVIVRSITVGATTGRKVCEKTSTLGFPPIVKFSLVFNVTVVLFNPSWANLICSPEIRWAGIASFTLNSLLIKSNIGSVTSW